jgi:hypothetical protein
MRTPAKNSEFLLSVAIILAMGWYVVVCVLHYLSQRPLWLDENMVFESVKTFAPGEFFTRKLAFDQVFPKLYLFFIQRIAEPFQLHILSVRFLSFFAMLTAFAVWVKIAVDEIKDRGLFLTYILSWLGSSLLVYYSAELKPYSMDVLASSLFMLFIMNAQRLEKERRLLYFLGMAFLPLLGLFSYPAFLFFIFLFYRLVVAKTKDGFWLQCCVFFGLAAGIALGGVYAFDIRVAHANTNTQGFSDHIVSFASVGEFFKTWWEGTMDLFCRFFAERPRIFKRLSIPFGLLAFGYMFYGFFRNFIKDGFNFQSFRTVALVIYGQLFVLGALHKYPFCVPRTVLFFSPIILLMIVESILLLRKRHRVLATVIHGAYVIFLLVVAIGISREAWSGQLGFSPVIF